jgi:hypothetical protein
MLDNVEIKEKKEKAPKLDSKPEEKSEKKEDKKDDKKEDAKEKHEKSETPAEEKAEHKDKPKEKDEAPILPELKAYKVELVKDSKNPVDSYYIASLDKPLFSVSARQAYSDEAEKLINDFTSDEYAKELTAALNKNGASSVYREIYASRGVILAQEDKLPDNKFEEPAKDMNVAPAANDIITNDDTKKESFADMVLEQVASVISSMEGATAQEFVDEMREIFSDETKAKQFEGRLGEKVDQKKKDTTVDHTPDLDKASGPGKEAAPDVQAMKSAMEKIKKLMPEIKATLKENEELKKVIASEKAKKALIARTLSTMKYAEKKAEFGLIDIADVKEEAIRLAKLSDDKLSEEVKNLENSFKIAKKITEKTDSNNIDKGVAKTASLNVLAAIPSQVETETDTVSNAQYTWSKGFKN